MITTILVLCHAGQVAADDAHLPVAENFSPLELVLGGGAAVLGATLLTVGRSWGTPGPAMGPPDSNSWDARLSRASFMDDQDRGQRFLGGLPDTLGATVVPLIPMAYYGGLWALGGTTGTSGVSVHERNPDHKLVAFMETMAWTYLITAVTKSAVGRPRPYTDLANNHPALRGSTAEDNLSFFSGHSSGAFAAGTFFAKDLSRYLRRHTLRDDGPVARALLGFVLPYALCYGIPAVVAVSRVIDQQHWPSDVVLGTATGVLVAHLTYEAHFDAAGRPRSRRGDEIHAALVPAVMTAADGSTRVTLAYAARF